MRIVLDVAVHDCKEPGEILSFIAVPSTGAPIEILIVRHVNKEFKRLSSQPIEGGGAEGKARAGGAWVSSDSRIQISTKTF